MKNAFKYIFILFGTFILPGLFYAQTKIQVVTRTISKSFTYKSGCVFEIAGEKANIQITRSNDKTIGLKLYLISKNPSLKDAESDLKFCDYKVKESNNTVTVSNFFIQLENYKEISSNLSARYEITIPSNAIVKIKNVYGNLNIKDVNGNYQIILDFCQAGFSGISGNFEVVSNYSDIKMQNTSAKLKIKAINADVSIASNSDSVDISDQYGKITLDNAGASASIYASMSEIKISVRNLKDYIFDFSVSEGDIELPDELKKLVTNKNDETRFVVKYGPIPVKVKTSYNTITLKTH
jgi:hypothetical protein